MRHILLAFSLSLLLVSHGSANDASPLLEVVVRGFESEGGRLAIALFDSEETYEMRDRALRKAFLDVENGSARWRVTGLKSDVDYVVIAYHDANGNEKLDTRILGIPKEKVGISNNVRGAFGPPKFERATFSLSADPTIVEIELQ